MKTIGFVSHNLFKKNYTLIKLFQPERLFLNSCDVIEERGNYSFMSEFIENSLAGWNSLIKSLIF